MPIVTKSTRGSVGTNNWTNPGNAVSENGVYATAAPAKNSSVIGDWDFAAFTDGELPVGSSINSVTIRNNYKVDVTTSVASLGVQAGNNAVFDTEEEDGSEPTADADFDVVYNTAPSITDLKTAGRLVARVRGIRGNSNTAVTFSLDHIELRVDYTAAPVLTSQEVINIGVSGGTPRVTTDQGTGTLYMVVVPDGDSPSVAQIKAGQQSNGSAALASSNQAVSASGVQTMSPFSGLSPATAYDCWFVHTNSGGSDSTAVKADFSTTSEAFSGTASVTGSGNATTAGTKAISVTNAVSGSGEITVVGGRPRFGDATVSGSGNTVVTSHKAALGTVLV